MIQINDFVTTMQSNVNNYIINEISKGIMRYSIDMAVDINEERCKKWINQAIEIENATPEQINDMKAKMIVKKLQNRVNSLEQLNEQLKKENEYLKTKWE